jgi:xanthine phosphoribosyltransferase
MDKLYYSYEDCVADTKILAGKIKLYKPDAMIAIARGGLTLGHMLSEAMQTREIYSLNSIHYDGTKKLDTFEIFNIPDCTRLYWLMI